MLPWYIDSELKTGKGLGDVSVTRKGRRSHRRLNPKENEYVVERIQTGVRMEKRLVKVLKAVAEYHDITLGDLLEGIVLHAFEGKCAFGKESQKRIAEFNRIYGLDLDAKASHRLTEKKTS